MALSYSRFSLSHVGIRTRSEHENIFSYPIFSVARLTMEEEEKEKKTNPQFKGRKERRKRRLQRIVTTIAYHPSQSLKTHSSLLRFSVASFRSSRREKGGKKKEENE